MLDSQKYTSPSIKSKLVMLVMTVSFEHFLDITSVMYKGMGGLKGNGREVAEGGWVGSAVRKYIAKLFVQLC